MYMRQSQHAFLLVFNALNVKNATMNSTVTRQTARWTAPVIVAYNALTGTYKTVTATVSRRTISTTTGSPPVHA
jgi:hypothetical protein